MKLSRKKALAPVLALPLAFGAVAASATAATAPADDAGAGIYSEAPVPDLMTAGTWSIKNYGTASIPAGTQFLVSFEDMRGTDSASQQTVTSGSIAAASVTPHPNGGHRYIITLKQPLAPGKRVGGVWSNHHFLNGTRDRVIISPLAPEYQDANAANNYFVYNNNGKGF